MRVGGHMKVAIYCRVSTADQSCERQERDLLTYAQRAGYEVVGVWKETDSGVKLNLRVRSQVIALAQDRKLDAVLVTAKLLFPRLVRFMLEYSTFRSHQGCVIVVCFTCCS
jgi:predicted site-specific integrase-resolvase